MSVRHVKNAEDYRDYMADKTLYDALQSRKNVPTIEQLVRSWVEHMREKDVTPSPSDAPK